MTMISVFPMLLLSILLWIAPFIAVGMLLILFKRLRALDQQIVAFKNQASELHNHLRGEK